MLYVGPILDRHALVCKYRSRHRFTHKLTAGTQKTVKIELCTPAELGPAEVATWRSLQAETPELDHPFLSPTFARTVGELDPLARVAVLLDGNEIAGFLPFHRTRSGIARGLAHGIAGCQGLLTRRGVELDPGGLLRGCRVAVWELDHLVVPVAPCVGEGAELPSDWAALARRPGLSTATTSVIDLSDGFDAFLRGGMERCKKYFNWLRRKRQRTELDLGPIHFEFATAGPDVLARLVEWKSAQYRRSGWPDPFAKAWVRELAERLLVADGADLAGCCSALRVGEDLLAADFSLRSSSIYAGWFVSYNRAFEHFSPGAVRWLYVAEACSRAGVSSIDLGCGDEEYKQKLAAHRGLVLEGHLHRPTPRALVRCTARAPRCAARQFVLEHPRLRSGVRAGLRRLGSLREQVSRRAGVPAPLVAAQRSSGPPGGEPAAPVGGPPPGPPCVSSTPDRRVGSEVVAAPSAGCGRAPGSGIVHGDGGEQVAMVAADAGGGADGED